MAHSQLQTSSLKRAVWKTQRIFEQHIFAETTAEVGQQEVNVAYHERASFNKKTGPFGVTEKFI